MKFRVAPHLVEDLGLNLYTDLSRALVEFVANAHDADAQYVEIKADFDGIKKARDVVRANHRHLVELQKVQGGELPAALAEQTLPEDLSIVIEDDGFGMSRDELEDKFLFAGRRRRESADGMYSEEKKRLVMGRKGVGKLAGFGIAHSITVTSRRKGETHATRIVLNYSNIRGAKSMDEIVIPEETLEDGGGILSHGTTIRLSRLVFEPLSKQEQTLHTAIAAHFHLLDPDDFGIFINDHLIEAPVVNYRFAWPHPNLPHETLVQVTLNVPDDHQVPTITFSYRMFFTEEPLKARERGVCVYAHRRLASAPDLLDTPTGMHGFRNTDYLQGRVYADFIDEQAKDYTATDRQSLLWDTPLLAPMREYLSEQMKLACTAFQNTRDKTFRKLVSEDPFTRKVIKDAKLSPRRSKQALRLAALLGDWAPSGLKDPEYQQQLQQLVSGLGTGDTVRALEQLAQKDSPELQALLAESMKLAGQEHAELVTFMEGRIKAIDALKKIVKNVDFKGKKNEREVQQLLKTAPWMIDARFSTYVVADETIDIMYDRLAKHLLIDHYAGTDEDDDTRPDLVFMLGSPHRQELIIVELKAPNVKLSAQHLDQLQAYMRKAKEFLDKFDQTKAMTIRGYLIGSVDPKLSTDGAKTLAYRVKEEQGGARYVVQDFGEILNGSETAHRQLIEIYKKHSDEGGGIDEADNEDLVVPTEPASGAPIHASGNSS